MPSKKRRHLNIIKLLIVIVAFLSFIVLGISIYGYFSLTPVSNGDKEVEFDIKDGENLDTILANLKKDNLIKNVQISKIYVSLAHTKPYYAGTFLLNNGMSTQEILDYIADPSHIMDNSIRFTIPEGAWAKEVAANLSKELPFTQEEILAQWNDQNYINELAQSYSFLNPEVLDNDQLKVKLEGYLFPETYYLDKDMSLDKVTRMFLDQFNSVYQKYKTQFDQSEMSVEEIVTLASIIQFESDSTDSMKSISGVFYNRLEQGMKLQSSVTVCYALYEDFSDAQACETQIDVDSPYNTYLHEGLPIGPILNPGQDAIAAALEPEENDYLFFAADIHNVKSNPGKVYYSVDYEEHQQIVSELNLLIE